MKKFIFALLCLALLLAAVSCGETPREPRELYADVISQYTALLTAKHAGEQLSAPDTDGMDEREAAIAEALYGIVNACKDAEAAESLGYGFKDMDGNGTPELILLTNTTIVRAIFTHSSNGPVLLESAYGTGNYIRFATKNRFYITRETITDNLQQVTNYTCRVDGDKIVYNTVFGEVCDTDKKEIVEQYQIIDGVQTPIDNETFSKLRRRYADIKQPGYEYISKLLSPRMHFPLKQAVADESLPVADFSSYAAIRQTYKTISGCLDEFDSLKWLMGEYDNLFAFPDDTAFDYYARFLYTVYRGGAHDVGYDELDLNGDGRDELVLMRENYGILAIFTQKRGVPVLVASFPTDICWLDEQGLIHVDSPSYYELEYSLYEFTKEGDYNLVYSILLDENYDRFLTRDGKIELMTYEYSMELYHDQYCCYPEPFESTEYTRNVSPLTYTPLTEPEEDLIAAAADKTWQKSADLSKTTGNKYGAYGNSYVTFDNVTDTRADVHFRYEFVSLYPDPNNEHRLLDDTTESTLDVTGKIENGVLTFEQDGVKGRIEFGRKYMWLVIEQSIDERFATGHHCLEIFVPRE